MKQAYISTHLADAQSAGDRFHLTPIILLAQAALERLGHLPPSP